jgi:hypothetical protein
MLVRGASEQVPWARLGLFGAWGRGRVVSGTNNKGRGGCEMGRREGEEGKRREGEAVSVLPICMRCGVVCGRRALRTRRDRIGHVIPYLYIYLST